LTGCFGAGCAEASGANGLTIDALTLEAQLHAAQAEDEGWLSAVRCLLWAQSKQPRGAAARRCYAESLSCSGYTAPAG